MTEQRTIGIVLTLAGLVGVAVAALADTLGIGEGNTFGWLQILGVVLGAVVALLGLLMLSGRMPYGARGRTRRLPGPRVSGPSSERDHPTT